MKKGFLSMIALMLMVSGGMSSERVARNAVVDPKRLWPDRTVYYLISEEFSSEEVGVIRQAMQEFQEKTCLKFVERTHQLNYAMINKSDSCSSPVGMVPERHQIIQLSPKCASNKGIVMHELMHTVGFYHEQSRPDRDEYISIDFGNILPHKSHNFVKKQENQVQTFGAPYDHTSLMHYNTNNSAIDPEKPTMTSSVEIKRSDGFSKWDLYKLKALYKC